MFETRYFSEGFLDGIREAEKMFDEYDMYDMLDAEEGIRSGLNEPKIVESKREPKEEGNTKSEPKGEAKKENFLKKGWEWYKKQMKGEGRGTAKKWAVRTGLGAATAAPIVVPTAIALHRHNKKKAAEAED